LYPERLSGNGGAFAFCAQRELQQVIARGFTQNASPETEGRSPFARSANCNRSSPGALPRTPPRKRRGVRVSRAVRTATGHHQGLYPERLPGNGGAFAFCAQRELQQVIAKGSGRNASPPSGSLPS